MADEKVPMTIRFSQKEHEAITRLANERQVPLSILIRQAVREFTGIDKPQVRGVTRP